jgi:2-octaprenyl-6-methoxyphenol hydroxylase
MTSTTEILIVGGGPVGATLALALQQSGVASTILEARSQGASHHDQRALALSYGSRMILERLGIWQELEPAATAINSIHISQRGSFGRSLLKAEDHGQESLGYVLSYGALCQALDHALAHHPEVKVLYQSEAQQVLPDIDAATVEFIHAGERKQLKAALVVLADGGRGIGDIPGVSRETKEYGHDALVSKVSCELPHDNIAYERFTPAGPMALLPNGGRDFSLVWTGKTADIQKLLQLDESTFLKSLHEHFGDRVGRFLSVGKRLSFPLKLSYLEPTTAPHLAIIGNAAQTMHPVAGQGFNVGLRDAWELAGTMIKTPATSWGGEAMLTEYRRQRRSDTKNGVLFTDFLVNTFSNDMIGLSALRATALSLLDIAQPIKQRLVRKMSYGARG